MINEIGKLNSLLPPKNDNYDYIKKITVGFPIYRIILKVLRKETKELPFTNEIILKLINEKISNVEEVCGILGVENVTVSDIIGSMAAKNLINIIDGSLSISKYGENMLKDLKDIEIKSDIFSFFIDGITGKLILDFDNQKQIDKSKLIREKIKVDEQYLKNRFSDLNKIYVEYQKDILSVLSKTVLFELHDIIEIKKKEIIYEPREIYLYSNTGNFDYKFKEKLDDDYHYAFVDNYEKNPKTIDAKYNRDDICNDKLSNIRVNLHGIQNRIIENISLKKDSDTNLLYYSDRELFEEEYYTKLLDGLSNCKSDIIIKTKNIYDLLYNNEKIFNSIKDSLSRNINIEIIFSNKAQINDKLSQKIEVIQNKGAKLFTTNEIINDSIIIFKNMYMIYTYSMGIPIKLDSKPYNITKDINTIIYDSKIINEFEKYTN